MQEKTNYKTFLFIVNPCCFFYFTNFAQFLFFSKNVLSCFILFFEWLGWSRKNNFYSKFSIKLSLFGLWLKECLLFCRLILSMNRWLIVFWRFWPRRFIISKMKKLRWRFTKLSSIFIVSKRRKRWNTNKQIKNLKKCWLLCK